MEMTANFWNPSASGGGDWRSTLLARAPQVVTFVLALALAAQLAFIVVAMTSRSRQAAPPPTAALPPPPQLDIGGLVNAHLFGNAAVQASGDAANAPPSSMPLVLAGVLATEDPKEGMAIIGESAQAAKVVAVGQQVPGGAQLHSVYSDRAIIDRGGTLESVFLPRRTGGAVSGAAATAHAGGGRRQRRDGRPHAQAGKRRPGHHRPGHAAPAGLRGRGNERFPRLPGRESPGVLAHGPARRGHGHGDQWHAAQRQGTCPGNLQHARFLDRCARHHHPQRTSAGARAEHRPDHGRGGTPRRRRRDGNIPIEQASGTGAGAHEWPRENNNE